MVGYKLIYIVLGLLGITLGGGYLYNNNNKLPDTKPTVPVVNKDCPSANRPSFAGVSYAKPCEAGNCVDVTAYTAHESEDCKSHGGICLLSDEASKGAKTFINLFNFFAGGTKCKINIASAIQDGVVGKSPSVSSCHHWGTAMTGTCADFNISDYESCKSIFYRAARESESVVSFLDEYVKECRPSYAGKNIHVYFGPAPEPKEPIMITPVKNCGDEDCVMKCTYQVPGPFQSKVNTTDSACLVKCEADIAACLYGE
jgi:hypothetical protein